MLVEVTQIEKFLCVGLTAALVAAAVIVPTNAMAEDCSGNGATTAMRANCEPAKEAKAHARMDAALQRALKAAEGYPKQGFAAEIRRTQLLWTAFSAAQCSLEAKTALGSSRSPRRLYLPTKTG